VAVAIVVVVLTGVISVIMAARHFFAS